MFFTYRRSNKSSPSDKSITPSAGSSTGTDATADVNANINAYTVDYSKLRQGYPFSFEMKEEESDSVVVKEVTLEYQQTRLDADNFYDGIAKIMKDKKVSNFDSAEKVK